MSVISSSRQLYQWMCAVCTVHGYCITIEISITYAYLEVLTSWKKVKNKKKFSAVHRLSISIVFVCATIANNQINSLSYYVWVTVVLTTSFFVHHKPGFSNCSRKWALYERLGIFISNCSLYILYMARVLQLKFPLHMHT